MDTRYKKWAHDQENEATSNLALDECNFVYQLNADLVMINT